jgi:hypothetical protein
MKIGLKAAWKNPFTDLNKSDFLLKKNMIENRNLQILIFKFFT